MGKFQKEKKESLHDVIFLHQQNLVSGLGICREGVSDDGNQKIDHEQNGGDVEDRMENVKQELKISWNLYNNILIIIMRNGPKPQSKKEYKMTFKRLKIY